MVAHKLRTRLLKQRRFRQMLVGSLFLATGIGILIVPIEQMEPGHTIVTVEDGLWWAIQTLTTVGYGDVTPLTTWGRILGVVLQLLGTVMFGSLIAIISSSMSRRQEEFYWNKLFEQLDHTNERIAEVEKHTQFLIKQEMRPKR